MILLFRNWQEHPCVGMGGECGWRVCRSPLPHPKLGVSDSMEGGRRDLRETSVPENIEVEHVVPIRDSFSLTGLEAVSGP